MTLEERQLLLIDVSARLPYGVHVHFCNTNIDEKLTEISLGEAITKARHNGRGNQGLILPYLRPMSSMTDDERDEFRIIGGVMAHNVQNDSWAIVAFTPEAYDWLNAHHFDYRGLIEKGLALEAHAGMYKTE